MQSLHPPLDRGQRTAQVRLQLLQLLQRVGLSLLHDLISPLLGIAQGLLGLPLDLAQDLMLLHGSLCPLVGASSYPACLSVRLRDQALLLLDRPVGLLDLLWQVVAELVDQAQQLLFVHHHLAGEGHASRVVDQVLQPVDDFVDLQWNFSLRRRATTSGTNWLTSPP